MIKAYFLEKYINSVLPKVDHDVLYNGLQVKGREDVKKITTGVSASYDFLQQAAKLGSDAVLVHHCIPNLSDAIGQKRVELLKQYNMNLYGYHLPLDLCPTLGNNAMLGQRLNLKLRYTERELFVFTMAKDFDEDFVDLIGSSLGRKPVVVNMNKHVGPIIGICTGKAQKLIYKAYELGCNVYISGEISEQTVYEAKELNMTFVSGGHYATERYGVQALGQHLTDNFSISCEFLEAYNSI